MPHRFQGFSPAVAVGARATAERLRAHGGAAESCSPEAEVDLTADSGIRYRILPHLSIVELVGAGASDLSDVVAVLDAALGDPVFRSGFGFLYDRRGLEPITPEQIRSVVNRLGRKEGLAGSRVALIVDQTGPAHMFHLTTVRGGAPLMLLTFHDLDQARLWLSMRGMP